MKKVIEFDDIVGGQDGGVEELVAKGNPFHLKVTRHGHGQYSLTVSRRRRARFCVSRANAKCAAIKATPILIGHQVRRDRCIGSRGLNSTAVEGFWSILKRGVGSLEFQ
jgi:hypothetical protein